MISSKTAVTLLLIILGMKTVTSTSVNSIKRPSSSSKSALQTRRQRPVSSARKNVLQDTTDIVKAVEVQEGSTEAIDILQNQPVPLASKQFEELIRKRKYDEIFELGRRMGMKPSEFFKQFCPVVKTFEQYKRFVGRLGQHKTVTSFYIYGDIRVVKEAIIESKVYLNEYYIKGGDLEIALSLALKEDYHNRVIDLFNVRKEITIGEDERFRRVGRSTSFEKFVYNFLGCLDIWEYKVALKRFLILHGNELRSKYPDILDTLCQKLVLRLGHQLDDPSAEKFLIDLIGQPSLLTPVTFASEVPYVTYDMLRLAFIKYGWDEVIEEGLKRKHFGGVRLWDAMRQECPSQFSRKYPDTAEVLKAVLKCFPTKRQLEERWIKENDEHFVKEAEEVISVLGLQTHVDTIIEYLGLDAIYMLVSHSKSRRGIPSTTPNNGNPSESTNSLTRSLHMQNISNDASIGKIVSTWIRLKLPVRYYLFDPTIPNDSISIISLIGTHKDLFKRVTTCIKSTEKSCVVHLKFKNKTKSIKIDSTSTEPLCASKDIFENVSRGRISGISVLYVKTKDQTKPTSTDTPVPVKSVPKNKDIGQMKKVTVPKTPTPEEQERLRKAELIKRKNDDDYNVELAKQRKLQQEREIRRQKEAEEKERAELEKKRKEEKEKRDAIKRAREERLKEDPVPQKPHKTPKQTSKKSIVIQPNSGKKKRNGRGKNGKNKKDNVTLTIPSKNVPVPKKTFESLPPADPPIEPIFMNEKAMKLLSKFEENNRHEYVILAREKGVEHVIEVMKSVLGELAITIESPSPDSNSFLSNIDLQQTSNGSTLKSNDTTLASSESNKKKKRKNRKMKVKLHPDELQFLNLPTTSPPSQQPVNQVTEAEFDEELLLLVAEKSLQEKNE